MSDIEAPSAAGGLYLAPEFREGPAAGLARRSGAELRAMPLTRTTPSSGHSLVLRVAAGPQGPVFFRKEFLPRDWTDPIKGLLRATPARRAWDGARALQAAGVRTPPLVALGRDRESGRSFLITEEIARAEAAARYFERLRPPLPVDELRTKRALLCEIGATLARMHRAGLFHTDARLHNIFWRMDAEGRPEVVLLDTDRVVRRRVRWLARHEAVRNLAQVGFTLAPAVTLTDRMRILAAYRQTAGLDRPVARRLGAMALRRLRRRIEKHLRQASARRKTPAAVQAMRRFLAELDARRR